MIESKWERLWDYKKTPYCVDWKWSEMYFECDWWLYMWAIGMHDFSSLPVLTQCLLLLMAHQESSRLVLRQGMWFIRKHLQVCMGRRSSAGDYSLWPYPTWHFLRSSAKGHLPTWHMVWCARLVFWSVYWLPLRMLLSKIQGPLSF